MVGGTRPGVILIMAFFENLFGWMTGRKASTPAPEVIPVAQEREHTLDLDDPWLRFMLFGAKPHGYGFRDVLAFDRVAFDTHHDFIQWLFPNKAGSPINPSAPRLTDVHLELYRRLPELRTAVGEGIVKFYSFLGFRIIPGGFERTDDFELGFQYWVSRLDHNHRRISRLLTFMCEIGERGKAVSLLTYLETELAEADLLGIEAILYWRAILGAPIEVAAGQ